jgi:hypothetical protein
MGKKTPLIKVTMALVVEVEEFGLNELLTFLGID